MRTAIDQPETGLMAAPGQPPQVGDLIQEFRRCLSDGDWYERNSTAEDTRFCVWDGQSTDGRKWDKNLPRGKSAFPWDGASDVRTFLADDVASECAEQKYAAFWRASARLQGIGPEDMANASQTTTFLDWWVHGPARNQIDTEVELSAQYDETFGWFGLHVTWEREIMRRPVEVSLQQLLTLAQQAPALAQQNPQLAEVAAALPMLLADPAMEADAVKAVQYLYDLWVRQNLPPGAIDDDILILSVKRAKQSLRDLRTQGVTELPVPYLCKNLPRIAALKPYRDLIFPPETGNIQDAPVVFIRNFLTEAQIRSMALTQDWEDEWVEAALKTRGKYSVWTEDPFGSVDRLEWRTGTGRSWLIEVVWAYYKTVDEDGIPAVEYCIFSPHVETLENGETACGTTGPLEYAHGKYPIAIGRRERTDRAIGSSRGTPEILQTTQAVEKSQFDSIVDLTSISVVPPLLVPKGIVGQRFKFGPAVQNEYVPGREHKMMEIPRNGAPLAFNALEAIGVKVDNRFGRFNERVSPATSQLKLEARVNRFLLAWAEALTQCVTLTMDMAPELFERVTGSPPPDGYEAVYDMTLHFDAAQLNPDLMVAKLDAYSKLLPEDAAGVIDRAKYIALKMQLIDPQMARALVSDQAGASQKLFRETQADLAAMAAGMAAPLRDVSNDPTSGTRLNFTQQLVQTIPPERLQDRVFQKRMQDYVANLQQGVVQQQNKTVGRLGVQPEAGA